MDPAAELVGRAEVENLDELTEPTPASTDYTGDMVAGNDQLDDDTQGVIDDLSDPNDFTHDTTVDDSILGVLPSGSCTGSVTIQVPAPFSDVVIDCADTADIRTLLGWIMAMICGLYLFSLVTTRPEGT